MGYSTNENSNITYKGKSREKKMFNYIFNGNNALLLI